MTSDMPLRHPETRRPALAGWSPAQRKESARAIDPPLLFVPIVLLLLATPAAAQTTGGYTAPAEFMDLFFDFTGSEEPGYPAGQPTLGQMLTQSVIAKEPAGAAPGPLVLVMGSDIYVYEFDERCAAEPGEVSCRSRQRLL